MTAYYIVKFNNLTDKNMFINLAERFDLIVNIIEDDYADDYNMTHTVEISGDKKNIKNFENTKIKNILYKVN